MTTVQKFYIRTSQMRLEKCRVHYVLWTLLKQISHATISQELCTRNCKWSTQLHWYYPATLTVRSRQPILSARVFVQEQSWDQPCISRNHPREDWAYGSTQPLHYQPTTITTTPTHCHLAWPAYTEYMSTHYWKLYSLYHYAPVRWSKLPITI